MITGIRTAVICDRVETDKEGRVNAFNLRGDPLLPESNPGFLNIWILIYLDLDRKPSAGHMRVEAADFETVKIPFAVPSDLRLTALMVPLLIPVLARGPLTVSIYNEERPGKPFRVKWLMELSPDAKRLDDAVGREFAEESKKVTALLIAGLYGNKRHQH